MTSDAQNKWGDKLEPACKEGSPGRETASPGC